jgi:putative ABC transport system substrate-binding protein
VTGGDPVETSLVANLNRPGGNVTGVSFTSTVLNPKRLELLHELVPKPALIAALFDPRSLTPNDQSQTVDAAHALGRQTLIVTAGSEREFEPAFAKIVQAGAGALFVGAGRFYLSQRRQLVALAARHSLPASYFDREFVEAGGLMSYGASTPDAFRRAGTYVGRILQGTKPSDLPVLLPTKYELVFNAGTAKALRLNLPPGMLALADEVIE